MNNKEKKEKYGLDLVSIIIPLYNTDIKVFTRCLKSIEKQDYKNYEVIIIDDYSDINYSSTIKFFAQNMNISYSKLDHNFGPGVARKIGLQMAEGKYVTFIDSDDELYDNTTLDKLVRVMYNDNNLDMVSGLVLEYLDNDQVELKQKNFIWVFGKLFRTQFFVENKLNFNDTRENEDNGFTTMFRMLTDKYKFIDEIVYRWRYEPNSITRKNDHEYYFTSIEGYVNNMIWVYNQCKERNIHNGDKQIKHFISVWIRLYFYCIEVLYDRNSADANLLSTWCYKYYDNVYRYIENTPSALTFFMEVWEDMVSSSQETFTKHIINISYPDYYNIITSGEVLIED